MLIIPIVVIVFIILSMLVRSQVFGINDIGAMKMVDDGAVNVVGYVNSGMYKYDGYDYYIEDGDVYLTLKFKIFGDGTGDFEVNVVDKAINEKTKVFIMDKTGDFAEIVNDGSDE